ncbi:metallophosphoesterase [Prevotella sp.]|uniref:metallophosphoesterase n=1 Tax=Prevotella sp. TaxID=59823 RepID=UPI003DA329CB
MKKISFLFLLFASLFVACSTDNDVAKVDNPFDPSSELADSVLRNKIVVISDLHLGNDLAYSENVKHLNRLNQFLKEVRASSTIKELVIAGDMFDEWYIPSRTNTYENKSQSDFILKTVAANKAIFDVLNGIITDKKIKVTYIPGNHDMGFTPANIDLAMPGVNQARDAGRNGLGTYHPDNYPEIAIEHGHRYDFFSDLTLDEADPNVKGTTFAPGYFFARIAANSFVNPIAIGNRTRVPDVVLNNKKDPEQVSKYVYYKLWKQVLDSVIYVNDNFDDKIITTNVDNFTKTYSINDVLPYNDANGNIQMKMYNGLFTQEAWNNRMKANDVKVMTPIDSAIIGSLKTQYVDDQSYTQYFSSVDKQNIRVVIFGHTHIPKMISYNKNNHSCVYANTGTWEDRKSRIRNNNIDQDSINMNFVVITPNKTNHKMLNIKLYKYLYGAHSVLNSKDVDLSTDQK